MNLDSALQALNLSLKDFLTQLKAGAWFTSIPEQFKSKAPEALTYLSEFTAGYTSYTHIVSGFNYGTTGADKGLYFFQEILKCPKEMKWDFLVFLFPEEKNLVGWEKSADLTQLMLDVLTENFSEIRHLERERTYIKLCKLYWPLLLPEQQEQIRTINKAYFPPFFEQSLSTLAPSRRKLGPDRPMNSMTSRLTELPETIAPIASSSSQSDILLTPTMATRKAPIRVPRTLIEVPSPELQNFFRSIEKIYPILGMWLITSYTKANKLLME